MKNLPQLALLAAVAVIAFAPRAASQTAQSPEKRNEDSRLERLAGELGRELVPYTRDPSLDSIGVAHPGAGDFDLVVLADNNPAISDECYKMVLQHAADAMMHSHPELSRQEALARGIAHVREMRQAAAREGRTYGAFFRHVVDCQEWCQPLVVGLEKCHVEAVSQSEPRGVFFGYNSDRIEKSAETVFGTVSGELARDAEARVLLVGRASRTGDKLYNRRLSQRRTLAVQEALVAHGVESSRIHVMWIGWEPPQINAHIAGVYGLGDVYASEGETAINQSVMIVVF
ncbi:MAG: OmpA family protein [Candidatus Krumholzibacteriia bacterium]